MSCRGSSGCHSTHPGDECASRVGGRERVRRPAEAQSEKTWFCCRSAKEKHEKDLEEMARKEVRLAAQHASD